MMTISDKILQARALRNQNIHDLNKLYPVVVSVRVNFPGQDKNHYIAHLIFNTFNLSDIMFKCHVLKHYQSEDGPYVLLGANDSAKDIKESCMTFENNHVLGRFFDIDVYQDGVALSRQKSRLCYLCGEKAHVCVRTKKHSFDDLYQFISRRVLDFYTNDLRMMIDEAMVEELLLEPKFGLVSKTSSGSHKDMDYSLMIKAKDAIVPYFIDIFLLSIMMGEEIVDYIDYVVDIGLSAEQKMFQVTKGVNCYKGIIFHIGLIVMAYGYYMSHDFDQDFQTIIKKMADQVLRRVYTEDTFGQTAYKNYQMTGAKGEALSGYHHAIQALKKIPNQLERLIYLMIRLEDTNLLKRAGSMAVYNEVKDALRNLDVKDIDQVNKFSNQCIKQGLSFGGSADMLVVSILLDKLRKKHDKIYL